MTIPLVSIILVTIEFKLYNSGKLLVKIWFTAKDFPARSVIGYVSPFYLAFIKNRPPSSLKSLRELSLRSLTLI